MCAWGERGGGSTKKSVKQSVRKKPYLPDHMSVGEVLELIIQAMFTLIFQTKMHLLVGILVLYPIKTKVSLLDRKIEAAGVYRMLGF